MLGSLAFDVRLELGGGFLRHGVVEHGAANHQAQKPAEVRANGEGGVAAGERGESDGDYELQHPVANEVDCPHYLSARLDFDYFSRVAVMWAVGCGFGGGGGGFALACHKSQEPLWAGVHGRPDGFGGGVDGGTGGI